MPIVIKSDEKHLVYGEVYSPYEIDTQGEAMTADEIEKMAHNFLAQGRHDKIDVGHSFKESGCLVVESFIARKQDPDGFAEGAWILGVKVLPDELWMAVKSGELNGFSFGGEHKGVVPVEVELDVITAFNGHTEKSEGGLLPPHHHDIKLKFTEEGSVLPGFTEFALGHRHPVSRITATDSAMEHSHRIIVGR